MRVGSLVLAMAVAHVAAGSVPVRTALAAEHAAPGRPVASAPRTPREAELHAAFAEGDRAISELRARMPRATSAAEATDLKRRIARTKLETEAAVLRVQAAWARRDGREELARRLEAEAVGLLAPRPRDAAAAARRGPVREVAR